MWSSTSVVSAASLLILGLPRAFAAPASCNANPSVASCLSSNAAGTAYCSSVLKVPASTTYSTSTVTPSSSTVYRTRTLNPAITTTTTTTSTVHVQGTPTTSTTTITDTSLVSTTTTTTTTPSCLTTGRSQPFGSNAVVAKRQAAASNSCFSSGTPSSSISSACACLVIPTSTTTVSRTVTAVQGTVYSDTFTRNTVTSTNTVYSTVTDTSTVTVPSTTTTTTTTTFTATATSIVPNGVYVRKYSINFDENTYRPHFPSDDLKAQTPGFADTLSEPIYYDNKYSLTFPNQGTISLSQVALVMQGYFIVPATGYYQFSTDASLVDNWQVFWIGDAAKQWINSEKGYDASRTTGDSSVYAGGSTSVFLVSGDLVPLTIITANGYGPSDSPLTWVSPDTTSHYYLRDYVIQSCGPLESTSVPA